jgi:multicomponent K+:H+ antiporter subunit A
MQYMASGFGWAARRVRVDYHALIGGGVLIAAATGISAMVFDRPFLTSGYKHFHWPVGDFELSSALAFDLGIFMTVVGGVMLALAQLSKLGEEISGVQINEAPMDYTPAESPGSNPGKPPAPQLAKRRRRDLPPNNPDSNERS